VAHPFSEHRQTRVEHSRVKHITKAYKSGGAVHKDEKQDRKLIKGMIDKAIHPEGHKSKHRMDRPKRAKGGRVKGNSKTIINVITGGHPAAGAVPPPPMGVAGPPPGAAMPPPVAAKPPMPSAGPGVPPGAPMPMRAKGGRVHKPHGSHVWNESVKHGTQVQHTDGKDDGKDIGRGRVVTFRTGGKVSGKGGYGPTQMPTRAKGGRVESGDKIAPATKLPGGSGGGEARLAKARRAVHDYHGPD
jgi:hypothetical protein